MTHFDRKDFARALQDYDQALSHKPQPTDRAEILIKRARLFRATKRFDDAEKDLQEALQSDSIKASGVAANRALNLLDQGKHREALAGLNVVLVRNPGDARIHVYVAEAEVGLGQFEVAFRDAEVATAQLDKLLDPEEAFRLGRVWALLAARRDGQLPAEKLQEWRKRSAEFALTALQQAVRRGYRDVEQLKTDPAFVPLRQREDFQKLLAELEAKGK